MNESVFAKWYLLTSFKNISMPEHVAAGFRFHLNHTCSSSVRPNLTFKHIHTLCCWGLDVEVWGTQEKKSECYFFTYFSIAWGSYSTVNVSCNRIYETRKSVLCCSHQNVCWTFTLFTQYMRWITSLYLLVYIGQYMNVIHSISNHSGD